MKRFFQKMLLFFASGTIGFFGLLIFMIVLNLGVFKALFGGFVIHVLSFLILDFFLKPKPELGSLPKEEYQYSKQQIKEASKKIQKIGASRFKIRSIKMWMIISRLYKLANQIVDVIKKEPARYRGAHRFFSSYLDSTVEILDRYTMLLSQPVKNREITEALKKSEDMLEDLIHSYEQELIYLLSDDVLKLDVELNVLEQSMKEDDIKITINQDKTKTRIRK